MELYDREKADAIERIRRSGRDPDAFTFNMSYLPPDPDGGGMFTVRYEVEVADTRTGKTLGAIGGIGLDWVGYFEEALAVGHFDA